MSKLLGLLPYVVGMVILALSYQVGYQHADRDNELGMYRVLEEHRQEVQAIQNTFYEIEQGYLTAEEEQRVVYKDKIVKVKEYVKSNTSSECSIDDDGLHMVNRIIETTNR